MRRLEKIGVRAPIVKEKIGVRAPIVNSEERDE
jgi:hypothetical protein